MDLKIFRLDRKDVSKELFNQIVAVEHSSDDGYSEEQLKSIWIEDEKDDNFVAMHGDKVIGHISFNPQSKRRNGSIYMVNLTVAPEYRKQGVGQQLIKTAVDYYVAKGETSIMSTSVDRDNIPAIKLYQKVGYEIKEPICELDEDDEQYILDTTLVKLHSRLKELTEDNCKQ